MVSFNVRGMRAVAIAAVVMFGTVEVGKVSAATPMVTYSASGNLSLISGEDQLELGSPVPEPFSMSITVSPSAVPVSHGSIWAVYSPLKMSITAQSGLVPTPISLTNNQTSVVLEIIPEGGSDVIQVAAPLKVLSNKNTITINAVLKLPSGTFSTLHPHPFSSVALTPSNATVTYSEPGSGLTTTLGITGTIMATAPTGAASAIAHLESAGAQVIATHADGSQTVRSLRSGPVDMGESKDLVELKFYAAGVRDASQVKVEIGGQEVPVRYAGPSAHFAAMDEVRVGVPRSLAGFGEAEVTLSVDGEAANPVHVRIQ